MSALSAFAVGLLAGGAATFVALWCWAWRAMSPFES